MTDRTKSTIDRVLLSVCALCSLSSLGVVWQASALVHELRAADARAWTREEQQWWITVAEKQINNVLPPGPVDLPDTWEITIPLKP